MMFMVFVIILLLAAVLIEAIYIRLLEQKLRRLACKEELLAGIIEVQYSRLNKRE